MCIIGGGYIGVELSEAFQTIGIETTLLECASHIVKSYFDSKVCECLQKELVAHNITLLTDVDIQSIQKQDQKVSVLIKNRYDSIVQ